MGTANNNERQGDYTKADLASLTLKDALDSALKNDIVTKEELDALLEKYEAEKGGINKTTKDKLDELFTDAATKMLEKGVSVRSKEDINLVKKLFTTVFGDQPMGDSIKRIEKAFAQVEAYNAPKIAADDIGEQNPTEKLAQKKGGIEKKITRIDAKLSQIESDIASLKTERFDADDMDGAKENRKKRSKLQDEKKDLQSNKKDLEADIKDIVSDQTKLQKSTPSSGSKKDREDPLVIAWENGDLSLYGPTPSLSGANIKSNDDRAEVKDAQKYKSLDMKSEAEVKLEKAKRIVEATNKDNKASCENSQKAITDYSKTAGSTSEGVAELTRMLNTCMGVLQAAPNTAPTTSSKETVEFSEEMPDGVNIGTKIIVNNAGNKVFSLSINDKEIINKELPAVGDVSWKNMPIGSDFYDVTLNIAKDGKKKLDFKKIQPTTAPMTTVAQAPASKPKKSTNELNKEFSKNHTKDITDAIAALGKSTDVNAKKLGELLTAAKVANFSKKSVESLQNHMINAFKSKVSTDGKSDGGLGTKTMGELTKIAATPAPVPVQKPASAVETGDAKNPDNFPGAKEVLAITKKLGLNGSLKDLKFTINSDNKMQAPEGMEFAGAKLSGIRFKEGYEMKGGKIHKKETPVAKEDPELKKFEESKKAVATMLKELKLGEVKFEVSNGNTFTNNFPIGKHSFYIGVAKDGQVYACEVMPPPNKPKRLQSDGSWAQDIDPAILSINSIKAALEKVKTEVVRVASVPTPAPAPKPAAQGNPAPVPKAAPPVPVVDNAKGATDKNNR